MRWSRTTAPTLKAVSLSEAKHQCSIDADIDDWNGLLLQLIDAATGAAESYLNRGLLTQTQTAWLDDWFVEADLPMAGPLQSITSVKYRAADGTLTTIASTYYGYDVIAEPGRIVQAPNVAMPALQSGRRDGRVQIVYVVGYTSATDVPADIRHGLLLLVGHWFANREAVNVGNIVTAMPMGVESLWAPYRIWSRPPQCE